MSGSGFEIDGIDFTHSPIFPNDFILNYEIVENFDFFQNP
jgi:hypothetical protein